MYKCKLQTHRAANVETMNTCTVEINTKTEENEKKYALKKGICFNLDSIISHTRTQKTTPHKILIKSLVGFVRKHAYLCFGVSFLNIQHLTVVCNQANHHRGA